MTGTQPKTNSCFFEVQLSHLVTREPTEHMAGYQHRVNETVHVLSTTAERAMELAKAEIAGEETQIHKVERRNKAARVVVDPRVPLRYDADD